MGDELALLAARQPRAPFSVRSLPAQGWTPAALGLQSAKRARSLAWEKWRVTCNAWRR